jgi:hypothetical protein
VSTNYADENLNQGPGAQGSISALSQIVHVSGAISLPTFGSRFLGLKMKGFTDFYSSFQF